MRLALTLLILSFAASPVLAQDPSQDAATQMQQQMQAMAQQQQADMQRMAQQTYDENIAANQRLQQQVNESMDEVSKNLQESQPVVYYAAQPKFSVKAGKYNSAQTVKITDATRGAQIYYTTDGWTPTHSSALYRGPVTISATSTLQAIAIAPYTRRSMVASALYTINLPQSSAAQNLAAQNSSSATQLVPGNPLGLAPGIPVPLLFVSDVNSKTASVGDKIQLALAQDLTIGNTLYAKRGALASGVVTAVDKTYFAGQLGVLKFEVESLDADGTAIPLVGRAKREGEAKPITSSKALIPVVGQLAVLKHGKDAEITPGTPFTARVATATPVSPPSQ